MFEKIIAEMNLSNSSYLKDKAFKNYDFGSPKTIDSSKTARLQYCKPKSNKHHYLLIKNFSSFFTFESLEDKYSTYPGFEKVVMIPGSKNAYIKFENMEHVQRIIEENESCFLTAGQKLKMCMVNKLPLDLNEKSKILLVTVYNEKIDINVHSVHDIFKDFGKICKLIIFKKKNYQIFIEFQTSDDATFFKEAFHNINYKGLFFLKIQFTQKNSLVVNSNNLYEHDFTKDTKKKFFTHSIDFILNTSHEKPKAVEAPYHNYLGSMNQLDEKNTSYTASPPKLSPTNQKRLFILKITNLSNEIKHKSIFNIFSLYGTIEKITIDPLNQTGYIYYTSEFDQITAYHYLNCIELFGKVICLELLKESEAFSIYRFSSVNDDSNTVYYTKNKQVKPEDVQNKQRTINKPSSILYVFNLSKSVSLDVIKDLFESHQKVEQIYYVNESRNSALCFFESIEAAINILCAFKNMNVVDKSMKINFANESLVKSSEEKYKNNYFSLQEFEETTKFSSLFRMHENTSIKADKNQKEKSKFAFNEFKLF